MVGTRGRNEGGRCDGHEFLFLFFYSLLHFFVSSQAYISYIIALQTPVTSGSRQSRPFAPRGVMLCCVMQGRRGQEKKGRRRWRRSADKPASTVCDDYRQQPITSIHLWPHCCGNVRECLSQREQYNSIYQQKVRGVGVGGCICVCAREREKRLWRGRRQMMMWSKQYQPRSCHSPPFPLLELLFCLQNRRYHKNTHTHTHTPSSLLLPASFSIICLSDACCGRIRADTPVPAATRGCHQHLNIFSLCCFSPFAPLCPCSTPTADKEHREDDK